jgi:hypothetical protein
MLMLESHFPGSGVINEDNSFLKSSSGLRPGVCTGLSSVP